MGTEKLETRVRREQIAKAALDLISDRGLKALSVASVARRVGLVPSAIYRHFESKDEVLDAAIGLIGRRLLDNVEGSRAQHGYSMECLRQLLIRHVELIRENRGIPRIVFSEDVFDGSPGRRKKMYQIIRQYLDRVAEIVRRAQRAGQVRPGLDPETVATGFLGMIQPAALLWHLSDGKYDVTRHAQRAWRLFADAVLASPGLQSEVGERQGRTKGARR